MACMTATRSGLCIYVKEANESTSLSHFGTFIMADRLFDLP